MAGHRIECSGVSAGYDRTPVVRGLDLHVDAGEVAALLGANGAGKTTTLLTIAGALPALAGEVRLYGKATTAPMHARCRSGMSFVTEERSVFMDLTVRENLRVARVDPADATAVFPELEPLMKRPAGLLSGGEQQMLSLARALGRSPSILLADELSLGLAPLVVSRLLDAVHTAATELGVAVLLVEQHVRQALTIADRAYVMARGRVTVEGPVAELESQLEVVEGAYLSNGLTP